MKLTKNDEGKIRIVYKFVWVPTRLFNDKRWLSKEYVVQKVKEYDVGGSMEWGNYAYCWDNYYWLDEPLACFDVYAAILKEKECQFLL